jgi:hypothetical protein
MWLDPLGSAEDKQGRPLLLFAPLDLDDFICFQLLVANLGLLLLPGWLAIGLAGENSGRCAGENNGQRQNKDHKAP